MQMKRLTAAVLALTMVSLSLAGTASAQAPDSTPPADPSSISVTVPVFGTSMVITVQTDATGQFVSADITPATGPAAAPVFDLTVDSNNHGGFGLNFTNTDDGVKIEVRVVDGAVTKTEVETIASADPTAATGTGQWTGDPLGNGNFVTVDYSVTLDANGAPVVEIFDPVITGDLVDTFFVIDPAKTSTHEGETTVSQTVLFYNAPDAITGAQDSMELTIKAAFEHGSLEVKTKLVDPSTKKGQDNDDNDDQGSINGDDASEHGSQKSDDREDHEDRRETEGRDD